MTKIYLFNRVIIFEIVVANTTTNNRVIWSERNIDDKIIFSNEK